MRYLQTERPIHRLGRLTRRLGFTLVEALVATTVTVMAGSAILLAVQSSLQTTQVAWERSTAQGIAQDLLDETAAAKYPAAGSTPQTPLVSASWAAGTCLSRATFDDLDDYHGYLSAPADRWGIPLGVGDGQGMMRPLGFQPRSGYFSQWRTKVEVFFVSDSNLAQRLSAGLASNHRAVRVEVLAVNADGSTRSLAAGQRVFADVPHP